MSVWQVTRGLEDFPLLFSLMRLVQSLLLNPHIHIEPYVSLLELLFFADIYMFWRAFLVLDVVPLVFHFQN